MCSRKWTTCYVHLTCSLQLQTCCRITRCSPTKVHYHHHQSLNREGRLGATDDSATSFLHFSLFSTALWDLPNSRPVHSLMLSTKVNDNKNKSRFAGSFIAHFTRLFLSVGMPAPSPRAVTTQTQQRRIIRFSRSIHLEAV